MTSDITDNIRDAVERLQESTLVDKSSISGCSDDKIRDIEQTANGPLPAAYKEFLRQMGVSAGDFLRGDDLFYPDMIDLTEGVRELMAESGVADKLPDSAFAFAGHHDYVYLYFDTAAGEDPPVYRYVEGDEEPEQVFDSFSAWFHASVDDEIEYGES